MVSSLRWRLRFVLVASSIITSTIASARDVHAQSHVHEYYVNDGLDTNLFADQGEFAINLGGLIRFSAYTDPNHYYVSRWSTSTGGPFHAAMLQGVLDFNWLDGQVRIHAPSANPIHPLSSTAWFLETTPRRGT